MKKLYISIFALSSFAAFAQQDISFEASEGYSPGTIHQQNGWEVTESSDGFIENQIITDELASEGSFSFKNADEPAFDPQWFPIFGAVKIFDTPADYTDFSISYDVLATGTYGADFEFTLFAVDEDDYYVPVAGVGIENRGYIYLINDANYGFEYATAEWTPNEWTNVRIEVTAAEIKYYINNSLEYSVANYTQTNIVGLNMLHNNYGHDAYYDNIVITTGTLGTNSPNLVNVVLFPNPTQNTVSLTVPDSIEISEVAIFNLLAKKVMSTTQTENIDLSNLPGGTYLLTATSTDGASITKKIVKE